MSGHSKWATIKHKKGAADKARGKLFAKLIRQVEVAAREGGGDLDSNATLRTMYQKARDNSVPLDTIERAIKRGTGELEGVSYEAVHYEGYAPAGVAIYVDADTRGELELDQRTRPSGDRCRRSGLDECGVGASGYVNDNKGFVATMGNARGGIAAASDLQEARVVCMQSGKLSEGIALRINLGQRFAYRLQVSVAKLSERPHCDCRVCFHH